MTKLEELTSVLVNEINDFKKSVTKLEKIKEELQTTKIKMEVSEYKSVLETHQQKMESHLDKMKGFENRFGKQVSQVKTYGIWVVVVFIVALLLCFGSLFYIIR
jgi:tRNA G26 N,N-dimethylase Trm1